MEYKALPVRKGFKLHFGYYVLPTDPTVQIPDPKKLEALHYAFRMRAKYRTPLSDCCMWLHAATMLRTTPSGFDYMYKKWVKRLRKEKLNKIQYDKRAIIKRQEKFIADNNAQFGIALDDGQDASALAYASARKEIYQKEKEASRADT